MNNKDKIIKKLRNSSMSYLARYEVSTYQFENTLKRKMSYYENDLKEEEKKNILNLIKEEMLKAKFIDDKRYAEIKTRSLRRQGGSIKFIYAKLKEKGISNEIIQSSIEMVDNGLENPEIKAAIQFMKKKSIGIFSCKNSICR
jgi:SOS response regulatory protein OraA/RecX